MEIRDKEIQKRMEETPKIMVKELQRSMPVSQGQTGAGQKVPGTGFQTVETGCASDVSGALSRFRELAEDLGLN